MKRALDRGIIPVLLAVVVAFSFFSSRNSRMHSCLEIQQLKAGFVDSLQRAKPAIGVNAYYASHPEEKVKVLAEINRQIVLYKPTPC